MQQNLGKFLQRSQLAEKGKRRGHLKVFLGYASGVGKTYALLQAANQARQRGLDVVVGYAETYNSIETAALLSALESIPVKKVRQDRRIVRAFDLAASLARQPQLIIVDDLAHTNQADSYCNAKRYQDIEELLAAGIDVYTAVSIQHIESLNDIILAITGISVKELIPDEFFDGATQVELVDIAPDELLSRLKSGKIKRTEQVNKKLESYFSLDNLTALREIALRWCADRIDTLMEEIKLKNIGNSYTSEHVLACLSSAPSNARIIRTAARMAKAFGGLFTALYVKTVRQDLLSEADKERIQQNMRLAEQLGAKVEIIYGEDVPFQIAEFVRLSGVSKIVIGRSTTIRRILFGKPTLTERLIADAPNMDIHIIPDGASILGCRDEENHSRFRFVFDKWYTIKSTFILSAATLMGFLFQYFEFRDVNIIIVYMLGVLLISIMTAQQGYSFIASIISVLSFNFFFTLPHFSFNAYEEDYLVTFVIMFLVAFISGSLAVKLKDQVKQSAKVAHRTKILFETNQFLEQAKDKEEIVAIAARQLRSLLNRDLVFYITEKDDLAEPQFFSINEKPLGDYDVDKEKVAALWALKQNKRGSTSPDSLPSSRWQYLPIKINDYVYGVVGISAERPLDAFEHNLLLSILGECAMALENERHRREKEEAAVFAQQEKFRSNLLRSISHDLRTPLTSISGNASNLYANGDKLDESARKSLYADIHDASLWLINLVENILSLTKIREGRMYLNITTELMEEVISESLRHINRQRGKRKINVKFSQEFILAKIDVQLIVQVIVNIVDNALKYTPDGSEINIFTKQEGKTVIVSIADNGVGIPDEDKEHVFEMFFIVGNRPVDSRRSLGLGLALCRSIINEHGGTIYVTDNEPRGSIFKFTLPAGEVDLHE